MGNEWRTIDEQKRKKIIEETRISHHAANNGQFLYDKYVETHSHTNLIVEVRAIVVDESQQDECQNKAKVDILPERNALVVGNLIFKVGEEIEKSCIELVLPYSPAGKKPIGDNKSENAC